MEMDLTKRVKGLKPLLTNPSSLVNREILNSRDAQLGVLLKDLRKTILHSIENQGPTVISRGATLTTKSIMLSKQGKAPPGKC